MRLTLASSSDHISFKTAYSEIYVNGYNDATAIYQKWLSVGPYTDLQFRSFDVGAAADVNHSVVSLDLVCPLLPGYCS